MTFKLVHIGMWLFVNESHKKWFALSKWLEVHRRVRCNSSSPKSLRRLVAIFSRRRRSQDAPFWIFGEQSGTRTGFFCEYFILAVKGKAISVQAWTGPDNRHIKVVRLPALHTGRLYPSGNNPGTHLC